MIESGSFIDSKISIKSASKRLAIWSIALYIILTVVFESLESNLSIWASVGMYLCLVMCALHIILNGKVRFNWIILSLLIFGVFLSFSILYTPTNSSIVKMYISAYWRTCVLLFGIVNVLEDFKDVSFLFNVFIFSGVVLAIYIYGYYGLDYLFATGERLDSTFGNQNIVSIRCSFSVILAAYRMITSESKIRWLWSLAIILCIPATMFLGSRKSIIMIVVALMLVFVAYDRNPKTKIKNLFKKIFLVTIVFIIFWYLINKIPAFSFLKTRFDDLFAILKNDTTAIEGSDRNRELYLRIGLQEFWKSPIWGNGFFYSVYVLGVYTHNNFVELLMNNGLLGFFAYYSIFIKLFFQTKKIKKYSLKVYSLFFMLLVTLIIMDLFIVSYYSRYSLVMLTMCSCVNPNEHSLKQ